MAGWEDVGAALVGNSAGNELAYQKGLALGANTQNAMAQARQRVRENTARDQGVELATALGIDPRIAATAWAAGQSLGDITGAANDMQSRGFRDRVVDPTTGANDTQRLLAALAPGSFASPFDKVGGGYAAKLNPEAGVIPLPGGAADGGGQSAQMQLLTALGLVDQNGRITNPRLAMASLREMNKVVDFGGVPGVVDTNPYGGDPHGVTSMVPSAPMSVPQSTAPAAPGALPVATAPLSTAQQVGANAAEIERQKALGKGSAEAVLGLPQKLGALRNALAQADIVNGAIDKALTQTDALSSGVVGQLTSGIGGTPARNLQGTLNTIASNAGFNELRKMRYESPTGGALGNVTERELALLQSTLASLDQAQSPEQLRQNLAAVRASYNKFKELAMLDYQTAEQKGAVTGASVPSFTGAPGPSGGGEVRVNTPQEAMALPPGTVFITPDGRRKVR